MEYNEKLAMRVCRMHGIEMVRKLGMPLYKGKEMSEDFSAKELFESNIEIGNNLEFSINLVLPFAQSNGVINDNANVDKLENLKYTSESSNKDYMSEIYDNQLLACAA